MDYWWMNFGYQGVAWNRRFDYSLHVSLDLDKIKIAFYWTIMLIFRIDKPPFRHAEMVQKIKNASAGSIVRASNVTSVSCKGVVGRGR